MHLGSVDWTFWERLIASDHPAQTDETLTHYRIH